MQVIPSVAKSLATKIAQRTKPGKAKFFVGLCAVLCAALLCAWGFREAVFRVTAADWDAGLREWKRGDCEAALAHWSKNGWARPFAIRPARLYYWRIRALERLGRAEEATREAALLALRRPLDFYSFVLAYEGKYPALSRAVEKAKKNAAPARRWEAEVRAASSRTDVSESILFGIIKRESKFDPKAVSERGALGLMQLMPPTARETAARLGDESLSPLDPAHNILLGAAHFAHLRAKCGRRLPLAVAAYNAGAAAVSRWDTGGAADWVEWLEDVSYPQTREYVRSVLENIEIYETSANGAARARGSFFARALLPPSFGGEFAEELENQRDME